jgi:hypothetical protein
MDVQMISEGILHAKELVSSVLELLRSTASRPQQAEESPSSPPASA